MDGCLVGWYMLFKKFIWYFSENDDFCTHICPEQPYGRLLLQTSETSHTKTIIILYLHGSLLAFPQIFIKFGEKKLIRAEMG